MIFAILQVNVINGISLSVIATICKFVSDVKNHSSRLFIVVKLLNLSCWAKCLFFGQWKLNDYSPDALDT